MKAIPVRWMAWLLTAAAASGAAATGPAAPSAPRPEARPASAPAAASAPVPTPASDEEAFVQRLWRNPTFQREFLGTYGARSDLEPPVSPEEKAILEQAMPSMGTPRGRDKARQLLERTAGPERSAVLDFTIGNIHLQGGQPDRAIIWYRRAIGKFPAFLRAHKNLGLAHVRRNAPAEAVEPFTRAISLGAADGVTYGLLGFAYAQAERFASAESAYRQAILLQPQVVDWQLGLARCLFRLRKFEEAVALCDDLIRREPTRAEYWVLQANACLGQKLPLKAAEIFEYLDLIGQAGPEHLNTLGDVYVNERLPDMAADAYLRAHARGGAGAAARLLRAAEVLAARGAAADAGRLTERLRAGDAESLDDAGRRRLLKLEARLAAARGDPDEEQVRLIEEIVRLDPMDGEALILLGQRYAAAGDAERAILQFERAASIDAFASEACLRHAQQLVRQRKFADALPLLKRSLDLRPRDDVARYMEQVERLARPRT
jgi:tetratricopeptide (TPR) repeat protein